MDFLVRVPTTSSRLTLEARVNGENWRDVLALVLEEVGRDASMLDRAHVHIRRDGRVIVEDPDTLRLFELRPLHGDEAAQKPRPISPGSPPRGVQKVGARPEPRRGTQPKPISSEEMRRPPDRLGRQPALKDTPQEEDGGVRTTNGGGGVRATNGGGGVRTTSGGGGVRTTNSGIPADPPSPIGFTAEPIPVVVVDTAQQPDIGPLIEGGLGEMDQATQTAFPIAAGAALAGLPLGRMDEPTQSVPATSHHSHNDHVHSADTARVSDSFGDLRAGRSLEVVAGTLLRAVRNRIPADAGVVLVPDGRRRYVLIAAGFGLPQQFKLRRFKYGDGVGGFVCEFDSAIRVDDLASRPDLLGEFEGVFKNLKGIVATPIRSGGETLGAVELLRARGEAFAESDQSLLREVCERQAKLIG
jgi:hypothetical protein